ncbi:MAG TPA: TetR/AcrR family transcriptional regulator [Stellaceae bacterium]|nr:TetR/AcrR family transcriptional regulator [Stellaceae bacterium]
MTRAAAGEDDGGKLGQILAAARSVFLEQGYAAATMDAVARCAGVSKATLYAYFEGKDALFIEMVRRGRRELTEPIRSIAATPDLDAIESLRRAGLHFLRSITHPDALTLIRVVIGEVQRFPELGGLIFSAGRSEILDIFAAALERCNATGALHVPDPDEAARQFLALIKSDLHLRCLLDPTVVATDDRLVHNVDAAIALMKSHYRPA